MKFKNLKKAMLVMFSLLLVNSFTLSAFAADIDVPEGEPIPENFEVKDDDVYVEIIDDSVNALSIDNSYESVIGMSDEEALQLYKDYLSSLPNSVGEEEQYSADYLNSFADYAVEQGIIEDTPVQRAAITKAIVRAEFKVVSAEGKALGFTTAATLLNHSLQDSPSNLSYGSSTSFASQILKSSECKQIVNNFKSYVKGKNLSARTTSGSTTLNSTKDLHLAYNRVSYVVSGTKKNGIWTLNITFSDTYDFETQAWKNAMTGNPAVTILNNYAAYAQSLKAIVPYKVKVTVKTTFRE